jgi:hypothetical protein
MEVLIVGQSGCVHRTFRLYTVDDVSSCRLDLAQDASVNGCRVGVRHQSVELWRCSCTTWGLCGFRGEFARLRCNRVAVRCWRGAWHC